jgi:hypothetical protein
MLAGDEGRSTGGAALLSIVIGEKGTFLGDAVNVRCSPAHHAAMVRTEIPHADVIRHYEEDVRSAACARHCWRLVLSLCRIYKAAHRQRRGGQQCRAAEQ